MFHYFFFFFKFTEDGPPLPPLRSLHGWRYRLNSVCVSDDLGNLLLGEAKLQQYLKENPIKQGASPRGPRPQLVEVRKHLTAALDRGNLKVDVNDITPLAISIRHILQSSLLL